MRTFRAVATVLSLLFPCAASAQWPGSTIENLAVGAGYGYQASASVCGDGAGGVIVAWLDSKGGTSRVRASRISATGKRLWGTSGIPVVPSRDNQFTPVVVPDGAGGAIIFWCDVREQGNYFAQRVRHDGVPLWNRDGVRVSTGSNALSGGAAGPDGSGGAVLTWLTYNGATSTARAQRIDSSGGLVWTSGGVVLAQTAGDLSIPTLACDGAGGAMIVWSHAENDAGDLRARRVHANGAMEPVVDLFVGPGAQATVVAAGDSHGAVFVWEDEQGGSSDLRAQRLAWTGVARWPAGGVVLCDQPGMQTSLSIDSDGRGGACVAWQDARSGSYDLYAQAIDSAGVAQWAEDGAPVCVAAGEQTSPDIVSDPAGGGIVSWSDGRGPETDLYVQRLSAAGAPLWASSGALVSGATGNQSLPHVVLVGTGEAVTVWEDFRAGWESDLYAQHTSFLQTICSSVVADFTSSSSSGTAPATYQFTSTSTGPVTSWAWDFDGDGVTDATGANPSFTYTQSGRYTVSLAVSDGTCRNVRSRAAYTTILDPPIGPLGWSADPGVNRPVSALAPYEYDPVSCTDGAGGAIVAWVDTRTGTPQIRAQRLSRSGSLMWGPDGQTLSPGPGAQEQPVIAADGGGGAVVAWVDSRRSTPSVFTQRVNANGAVLWGPTGVQAANPGGMLSHPSIASTGVGDALIAWEDLRSGAPRIFAQRVSGALVSWGANGAAVSLGSGTEDLPRIVADGAGGCIVVWCDRGLDLGDIEARRLDIRGIPMWPATAIARIGGLQNQPMAISDGKGGAILTWDDGRTGELDVYAQRVDSLGQAQWINNGIAVCTVAGDQIGPVLTSDGDEGAIIAWNDQRTGVPTADVYAQRVSGVGVVSWIPGGLPISTAASFQSLPSLVPDGAGGAVITWMDNRFGATDVYGQRVTASGELLGQGSGFPISSAPRSQTAPVVVGDDLGNAVVVWRDDRANQYDVYAQHTLYTSSSCPSFTADFIANPTVGNPPFTVQFLDQSTDATSWQWDFDSNGTIDATIKNPTYTYPALGVYSVSLVASNGLCSAARVRSNYITVQPCASVTANFTANVTQGEVALAVQFTDASVGAVTGWQWDFDGNGTVDATVANPTHVYTQVGVYTVSLRVNDANCSNTLVRTGYIRVVPCTRITADFSAADTVGAQPLSVAFTDLTTGPVTQWAWDFDNDGVVESTVQNPVHVYPDFGTYSVRLTSSDGTYCTSTQTRLHMIRVLRSYRDSLTVGGVHPATSSSPAIVPVGWAAADSLGALSLPFVYDPGVLRFVGLEDPLAGRSFVAGASGGRVSVQWFDETGGAAPILPGRHTLFSLRFEHVRNLADSTSVRFDSTQARLAGPRGTMLNDVTYVDEPPHGVVVYPAGGSAVSGHIRYYLGGRPVPRTDLRLLPVDQNTTSGDPGGDYAFGGLAPANYTLVPTKDDDLGGINSLDGIKIVRHAAGIETLTTAQRAAGNVNDDAVLDALDAYAIARASAGLGDLPSGDWRFTPNPFPIPSLVADRTDVDFAATRMGDVNGDWEPDNGSAPAAIVALEGSGPALSLPVVKSEPGVTVEVPLRAQGLAGVGALSLRIGIEGEGFRFDEVTTTIPGLTLMTNRIADQLRIEWFDLSGGARALSIADGTLLTLKFTGTSRPDDWTSLTFLPASTLGDAEGDAIAGVRYTSGVIEKARPGPVAARRFALHTAEPNPFVRGTRVRFDLSREGPATLQVFDVGGRLVRTILNRSLGAGEQVAEFDGLDDQGARLGSGIYVIRLNAGGETQSRKAVLLP